MKPAIIILLFHCLSILKCSNLRNLKLMDTKKYDKLVSLANQTLYQIYTLQAEFNDKTYKDLDNTNFRITIEIREDDTKIPTYNTTVIIPVSNGKAQTPEITYPKDINLELVGTQHTLKEQFEIFSSSIAHAYDKEDVKGSVIIYKSEDIDNVKAQSRFRMMVNSTDDKTIYGWIEIVQEDKNDKNSIISKISEFYKKIKAAVKVVLPELKLISETVSTFSGIIKDIKKSTSSFSYLKFNSLNIFVIMSILLL